MTQLCASLLEWATRTMTFSGEAGEKYEAIMSYTKACKSFMAVDTPDDPEAGGGMASKAFEAIKAIQHWLGRLEAVCVAALFIGLLQKQVKSSNSCINILPPELQRVAHALEVDWAQEVQDVAAEMNLESLLSKLPKYEFSMMSGGDVDQAVKESLGKECENFQSKYLASLTKALEQTAEVTLPPLDRFLEKFKEAEGGDLKKLEWIFKETMEDEVQQCIQSFSEARDNFVELAKTLGKFNERMSTTQSATLKDALKKCDDLAVAGKEKSDKGVSIASIIVFSHVLIVGSESAREVEQIEEYTKKTFGVDRTSLPTNLLNDLNLKIKSLDGQEEKEKDKKQKKDKKSKGEKRPVDEPKSGSKSKKGKK